MSLQSTNQNSITELAKLGLGLYNNWKPSWALFCSYSFISAVAGSSSATIQVDSIFAVDFYESRVRLYIAWN